MNRELQTASDDLRDPPCACLPACTSVPRSTTCSWLLFKPRNEETWKAGRLSPPHLFKWGQALFKTSDHYGKLVTRRLASIKIDLWLENTVGWEPISRRYSIHVLVCVPWGKARRGGEAGCGGVVGCWGGWAGNVLWTVEVVIRAGVMKGDEIKLMSCGDCVWWRFINVGWVRISLDQVWCGH